MVILGAGGFAKEILQVIEDNGVDEEVVFYDDVNSDLPALIFDKYRILRNKTELQSFFEEQGPNFIIGIGKSTARAFLLDMATKLGGQLQSAISSRALIGNYSLIGQGATILNNANISNSAIIGTASLLYYNVIVTHDCNVGDFVELSPGATLLGHVTIGDYTQVGANATILPNITIGSHCIVGAGAVVTKDVPDNSVVVGVPARILKPTS